MIKQNTGNQFVKVIAQPFYAGIALAIALLFFIGNIALKNLSALVSFASASQIKTALNLLASLVLGFHKSVTISSYISLVLISILIGILASLMVFRLTAIKSGKNIGLASGMGIALGIIAPSCAACGVGLAAVFGITGTMLALLPFKGLEISLLAIALLFISIWNLSARLNRADSCQINHASKFHEKRKK